ncbi:MAG: hypothetical protein IT424_08870 [Pirellulales bacterium]|nr:hypothetical protein [Pirellulales bacterium]
MNAMDEPLTQIEAQLTRATPGAAPRELRAAVLADVSRELKSSRWDRRLARTAAAALAAGVAINGATALIDGRPGGLGGDASQASLVEAAVAVGRATDAETGRTIARQLAAWSGSLLTHEQVAALDAEIVAELRNGKDG